MNMRIFFFVLTSLSFSAIGGEVWRFDTTQLDSYSNDVDISIFERNGQLPGVYLVEVMLNGERIDYREMMFHQSKNVEGKLLLKTCLTRPQLVSYGVKVADYPNLFSSSTADCAYLEAIPQATEEFNFNTQQLLLSIPQIALQPKLKGLAPRELWDEGAQVFLMNYRANAVRSESRRNGMFVNDNFFARLDPGINLGAWRLRNITTWQKSGNRPPKWQITDTWAERGLYGINSRLTLGERSTPADIFGSVPFRGLMLGTDERMVPYNQRSFVPVVKGIARTQALVEVRQAGYLIYSTTVAPGAYELSDLSASSNGDLDVTVIEANGQQQHFIVPLTSPAISLHKGYMKYNLMAGQYRPANDGVHQATVAQATMMYGLPLNMTAYGGLQWSEHYQGASLGIGFLMGRIGALSFDGTEGLGDLPDGKSISGKVWRIRYNKTFDATGTGVFLDSMQYDSGGSASLRDVLERWPRNKLLAGYHGEESRSKARTSLSVSQSLGDWGGVSLSGSRESYWNTPLIRDEVAASYGNTVQGISFNISLRQRKSHNGIHQRYQNEQLANLWFSVPLNHWLGGDTYTTWQVQSGNNGRTRYEAGLGGHAFDRQLRWNVREQLEHRRQGENRHGSSVNVTWNGAYGIADGGYSYSNDSRQMSLGLSGGMIFHKHGVTFGQPLNGTTALVYAPGASGVSVGNWDGVKTDFRGYATQTSLNAFQENLVQLDPSTLPSDAEVLQTDVKVVPTPGAVIPVQFATRIGGRALITLRHADGKLLPFGAMVKLTGDNTTGMGIVGEDSKVYMSGLTESGVLQVQWGNGNKCLAKYHLPKGKGTSGVYNVQGLCNKIVSSTSKESP